MYLNFCNGINHGILIKILTATLRKKEDTKPVNPKGNQPWKFIWRTDAETEAPIFWPPDAKTWLTGKDPDAGKDWGQEEKGTTWWDGWMASLTQWTCVWASSRRWWWTGNPGMLQFKGSQRTRHNLGTEKTTVESWCITQGAHPSTLSLPGMVIGREAQEGGWTYKKWKSLSCVWLCDP